jgi:alkanesulfonate monooxygenase SsuD/methylene tetrahydromethanopterin reductase-like flavin-dependent oxidoreductase (luciferase family)
MYAARFPRYRSVMEDAGFTEEVGAIRQAWERGAHAQAQSLVPDALVDSMSLVGTPEECRERIQTYRDAGITLPIIMLSVDGERAVEQARETIRACAPV